MMGTRSGEKKFKGRGEGMRGKKGGRMKRKPRNCRH